MTFVTEEIQSQPEVWRRAAAVAAEEGSALPERGARVALFGCGTSLYVAQAIAAAREAADHGETDAFPASEMPLGRRYDLVVAVSRSGTTTEVVELTRRLRESTPVLAVTAQADGPLAALSTSLVTLDFADAKGTIASQHYAFHVSDAEFDAILQRVKDAGLAFGSATSALRVVRRMWDTGIAHREPGIGQIGAGIVRVPIEPFDAALLQIAAG